MYHMAYLAWHVASTVERGMWPVQWHIYGSAELISAVRPFGGRNFFRIKNYPCVFKVAEHSLVSIFLYETYKGLVYHS